MNVIELGRMSRRLVQKNRQQTSRGSITNSGMNGLSLVSLFESAILVEQRLVLVFPPIRPIIAVPVLGGSLWPAMKRLQPATC